MKESEKKLGIAEKEKQKADAEKQKFSLKIRSSALRKLRARRNTEPRVWLGLGMMGLIGWSVAVPTLAGAALGIWLDQHISDERSWTLALLVAGLTLGCLNAWHWMEKEEKAMQEGEDEKSEQQESEQQEDARQEREEK